MTDTEGSAATAATATAAPYDPKAIFFEEWDRVSPPQAVLGDYTAAKAWAMMTDERPTGRVVDAIPIDTYRMIARASAHKCAALVLAGLAKEHATQAEATVRIAHHDLRHLGRVVECATYDVKDGLVRECSHEHGDGEKTPEPTLDAKIVSLPLTAALVEMLKNAGILGGV